MGIKTTFVTLYGIKVPFEGVLQQAVSEKLEDYVFPLEHVCYGMDYSHIFFGKILLETSDEDGGGVEIDPNNLADIRAQYYSDFLGILPEFKSLFEQHPWRIHSFVNYH